MFAGIISLKKEFVFYVVQFFFFFLSSHHSNFLVVAMVVRFTISNTNTYLQRGLFGPAFAEESKPGV